MAGPCVRLRRGKSSRRVRLDPPSRLRKLNLQNAPCYVRTERREVCTQKTHRICIFAANIGEKPRIEETHDSKKWIAEQYQSTQSESPPSSAQAYLRYSSGSRMSKKRRLQLHRWGGGGVRRLRAHIRLRFFADARTRLRRLLRCHTHGLGAVGGTGREPVERSSQWTILEWPCVGGVRV